MALLIFYWLVMQGAERHGMTKERAGRMFVTVLLSGLLAGVLWTRGSGISATGAVVGAMTGFLLFPRRVEIRQALDLMSLAIVCAYVLTRFGCFLAHDHPGRFTDSWMGVRYPEGVRFDLGLLQCVAALVNAAGAALIDRANTVPGSVFAWVATMLGLARLAILPLGNPVLSDWTVAACLTMAGIGVAIFCKFGGSPRSVFGGRFPR